MSEQLPQGLQFKAAELHIPGFSTQVCSEDDGKQYLIIVEDTRANQGDLRLYVEEARALRDYLNEILP